MLGPHGFSKQTSGSLAGGYCHSCSRGLGNSEERVGAKPDSKAAFQDCRSTERVEATVEQSFRGSG